MATHWKSECRIAVWRRAARIVCAFLSLMLARAALADSSASSSDFMVSGFGTAGLVSTASTEPWLFRRDQSQSAELGGHTNILTDSRFGIQVNYQIDPQWELVGQVVAASTASDAPASQYLQWAFLSYKPTQTLTIRLGRTSPDIFLLADYRDVGFAYPWVRPNTEFYGWVPNKFVDGIDITKVWYVDSALWKAKAGYGRSAVKNPASDSSVPSIFLSSNDFLNLGLAREQGGLTAKLMFVLSHQTVKLAPEELQLTQELQEGLQQLQQGLSLLGPSAPPDVVAQNQTLMANLPDFQNRLGRYFALGCAVKSHGFSSGCESHPATVAPAGSN